jgi:hypothetical protein
MVGEDEPCHHTWTLIHRLDHCEIDEKDTLAHTAIILLGCIHCRTVEAFPPQNAELITERYRGVLERELAREGWDWGEA